MQRRVVFRSRLLPWLLLAPQLGVTLVFFLWPAAQALEQALYVEDAFGFTRRFVGLANFEALWNDPEYLGSFGKTALFTLLVTAISMTLALGLALAADRAVGGALGYRTALIWPYAVAPAVAGVLWYFLLNPSVGVYAAWLDAAGIDWNHYVDGTQAFALIVAASVWKQISYNFLFFLAALQSIPRSLIEAAAIDNAGPARRFLSITLPLISPTTFFLVVVNMVYAFFETFATVHATTSGGPAGATSILVYKVYETGFIGQDYGSSAAQSVVLMALVIGLTMIQFRYVERRVVY